jgi:hypothetical protein
VYILEILNNFFKAKAAKERERELALKDLAFRFDKPPFLYTLEDISKFTNKNGIPLLGKYSQEDLESYIRTKTTEHRDTEMPELLIIRGLREEQWFIKKDKLLPLCARLLAEARPRVKKAISRRWYKLLKNYSAEPAMENDGDFEKLVTQSITELAPVLLAVLRDQKLPLIFEEYERAQNVHGSIRLFNKGVLIPLSTLLMVKRKNLLADARILLPFWHAIPLMAAIIAFFKNLGKKKRRETKSEDELEDAAERTPETGEQAAKAAARELVRSHVPDGYTLETYLEEMESRWSRLIDKKARKNLREDVNFLIRDRLRQTLRFQSRAKVTGNVVRSLAAKILRETPSLGQLTEQEALANYIQLYIIKLVVNSKI